MRMDVSRGLLRIGVIAVMTAPLVFAAEPTAVIWRVDQIAAVGGHTAKVLGAPRVIDTVHGNAVSFDGVRDGLIVPANPLSGWSAFTIEVLFQPLAGGLEEQRFLHVEGESGNERALLETRLTPDGQWALDTFLLSGTNRLPLLDRTKLHPAGAWHWVALRYDGQKLASFVNGRKELEGDVTFPPMKAGRISLGVRQNEVYWFKGTIREVRFHPNALSPEQMQAVRR
jgi:hypothetical protein